MEPFTDDKKRTRSYKKSNHSPLPLLSSLVQLVNAPGCWTQRAFHQLFTCSHRRHRSNVCCASTTTASFPGYMKFFSSSFPYLCFLSFLAIWHQTQQSQLLLLPPPSSSITSCDYGCRPLPKGSMQICCGFTTALR